MLGSGPYKLGKSSFHTLTSSQRSFVAYISFAFALPRKTSVEYDFPCCGGWIAKRIALHLRPIFQHQVRCLRLEKGTWRDSNTGGKGLMFIQVTPRTPAFHASHCKYSCPSPIPSCQDTVPFTSLLMLFFFLTLRKHCASNEGKAAGKPHHKQSMCCYYCGITLPYHFVHFFHPLYLAINQYHNSVGKGSPLSSMFAQGLLLSTLALIQLWPLIGT